MQQTNDQELCTLTGSRPKKTPGFIRCGFLPVSLQVLLGVQQGPSLVGSQQLVGASVDDVEPRCRVESYLKDF